MAITDNISKVSSSTTARPVVPTLSSPGHSIGGTSITISSSTNWDTTTVSYFTIYKTTTIGGATVKDTSTQTDWKGTLSGTTISNMTLTGGTDQAYSAGDIVELTPTSRYAKDLADNILVQHKQDGTHADTITTDTINENTAANGVTVDGLNIKDSKLTTANSVVTANITDAAVTQSKLDETTFDDVAQVASNGSAVTITSTAVTVIASVNITVTRATDILVVCGATANATAATEFTPRIYRGTTPIISGPGGAMIATTGGRYVYRGVSAIVSLSVGTTAVSFRASGSAGTITINAGMGQMTTALASLKG